MRSIIYLYSLEVCDRSVTFSSCSYENIRYHLLNLVTSLFLDDSSLDGTCIKGTLTHCYSSISFEFVFSFDGTSLHFPKGFKRDLLFWIHWLPRE